MTAVVVVVEAAVAMMVMAAAMAVVRLPFAILNSVKQQILVGET